MTQKSHNTQRIAVFPGSFDPFTIGHLSVVERGLQLFDKVIVAIGYNEHKTTAAGIEERLQRIREAFGKDAAVDVDCYSGLTVDYARRKGARFILRGARTYTDFEYERNLADVNRKISGIETVILFTLPEHAYISSSMVRELQHNDYAVDEFVAPRVIDKD